jgi:hypothetical protein
MSRIKVALKKNLSDDSVEAVRAYLATFLEGRHAVEYFDGKTSIYLKNEEDMLLLKEHVGDKMESIQRAY